MRKHTTSGYVSTNSNQNQFKGGRKNLENKKNPRYIYTEEDLGEGILDAGISSYRSTDQQNKIHTAPWNTMLKTNWV